MTRYEVIVESMTPCGGAKHGIKEFLDVETESPEVYVKEHGQYPIIETVVKACGDTVITTGDGHGYVRRYTFTE